MIVDVPGWPQPLVLGEAIGAKVKKLVRNETSGWMFDFDQLTKLITPKTKLIFICNPNNPTGQVLTEAELKLRALSPIPRPTRCITFCVSLSASSPASCRGIIRCSWPRGKWLRPSRRRDPVRRHGRCADHRQRQHLRAGGFDLDFRCR